MNNEDVGVITEVTQCHGIKRVTRGTIVAKTWSCWTKFSAFAPSGLLVQHTGDANDYVGKGYQVVLL